RVHWKSMVNCSASALRANAVLAHSGARRSGPHRAMPTYTAAWGVAMGEHEGTVKHAPRPARALAANRRQGQGDAREGGLVCAAIHAENELSGSATIRNAMCACCTPQNSAHWPWKRAGTSAWSQVVLTWPGMRSRLPCRLGTQKLWMTSRDVSSSVTGRPTGKWISLAVVTVWLGGSS